jgi:hypothetical protein
MIHCVEKTKNKRKQRRNNGGQLLSLTVSVDPGDLLGALDSNNGGAAGSTVMALQHKRIDR